MADPRTATTGSISWADLTVPDAVAVKDFYAAVTGWRPEPLDMGGYEDFNMMPAEGEMPAAGICHQRGTNADLPPQWLVYITVADIEASMRRCVELGGRIVSGPKGAGGEARYCVIQDPAGAYAALFWHGPAASE